MNKKENKIVPSLRFPDFVNEGEWEYFNGNELFKPISNKNHKSDLPILAITQDQGAIPRKLIDYHVSVSKKSIKSYKVVEVGDFIISLRSFQGGIEYSNYFGLCSPAYIILRKKIQLTNDFYRYYFKSFPFIQDLNKNLEGIRDGKMVSYKQFSEILIPKPKKQEQEKIANCLSSLEDVIITESEKFDLLQDHKKGLLQQLFPAEGKTKPQFRFPEFKDDGDWELSTIGELGKFYYGKSAPKWSLSEDAPTLCVRYGELYSKFGAIIKNIYSRTNIDPETLRFSKGGEILVPRVGEDPFAFSNCSYLPFPDIAIGEMISVYETEENPIFFTYYFNTLSKQFARVVEGQNVKNLYYVNLEPIEICKPRSKKEQQKIANCLSSVDELIETQTQKIKALKKHKKGLMQQLFPNVNELTV
ncbi:restriction endonuclease subunit S [Flagellimonas aquimarina]|uniref:Restriction endonuclease subunit S n=1 Tax=Flagellimonas aquimarina TaxID=2201895 RepID=A0A316KXT6_9FLAO|nr:restriction endonuclease subunit S [Allomuricauda koreensis]PWL37898.1 restriction endonuclease subunit S [Allomuricauda koreensis]